MAILRRALLLVTLGTLILAQSGCATSEEDLGYSRDQPADAQKAAKNDLSHGWGAE